MLKVKVTASASLNFYFLISLFTTGCSAMRELSTVPKGHHDLVAVLHDDAENGGSLIYSVYQS